MSTPDHPGLQTLAVHAGERRDLTTRASAPNLVMSTTFLIDPDIAFSADELQPDAPFVYTRWGNPTVRQLEDKLAAGRRGGGYGFRQRYGRHRRPRAGARIGDARG